MGQVTSMPSGPRLRRARNGPELEMVHAALAAGLPFRWSSQAVTFQEPELPSGAPDILLLRMNQRDGQTSPMLSEQELKLLHFVSSRPITHVSDLCDLLCWTPRVADRVITSLQGTQFLTLDRDRLRPTHKARLFLAREIVAIEAKIGEWKRAIAQAQRNQWFASQSYVLLKGGVSPSAIHAAIDVGVGILHFDGERARVLVKSERARLPGSYASWLVSMWAHHEVCA
jgi:hypothetical protein